MKTHDLAIVGAGLAGLFAARLLAERGQSVVLIDRKNDPGLGVHTTGIFVRKTFEDYAFLGDFLGPSLHEVKLFSPRGRVLRMTSPVPEFRVGQMARLYRKMLDAARQAGAEWLPGTSFLGLEESRDIQRLCLKRNGERTTLPCRFVIGADGARSRVATALGLHRNRRFLVGIEKIYENGPNTRTQPGLYCYLNPELAPGYLAWVTVDAQEKHVGVAGLARRFSPGLALDTFIRKVGPDYGLEEGALKESRGGLIPVGGIGSRLACTRGLLVGDSTGAVSPLTAGGLDPCLRLTEFACQVAHGYLATGDSRVLEAYHGRRFRARFAKRLFLRYVMDRMTSPLLLEAAFSLLALPPFRFLPRQIFFRRGSFPNPGLVKVPEPERPLT